MQRQQCDDSHGVSNGTGMRGRDGGTRIVYDADLALKGAFKLADPLLRVAFRRVGARQALRIFVWRLATLNPADQCLHARDGGSDVASWEV